jgi:DNA polymerase-3 subunit delta
MTGPMHVSALLTDLQAGRVPAVALIVGEERFFVDRALAALRTAVLGVDGIGLNEDVFEGKGTSAARVLDAARTLPMLADKRLVLVREAGAIAPSELDKLADYLEQPYESCCLVLVAQALDGRTRLSKRAAKVGCLVEASGIKLAELRGFVQDEARRRKVRIEADAIAALLDAVGNDLPAIDDALERLSLFVGDGHAIDLAAVETCVARVRVESIWALVDAVGLRDRRTALRAAASLLADREPPLRILAMVARQLRMLARMQGALDDGAPPQDAARMAGAPPFKARDLATAARRFEPRLLARAFSLLAEADLELKGSRKPPELVLEGAILALTR